MKKHKTNSVLMLSEAGEGIGYGHFTRCLAIQQYLNQHHMPCTMLLYVNGKCADLNFSYIVNTNWHHASVGLKGYSKRFNTVIIDSYLASENRLAYIRSLFRYVIAIDDYNRLVYPADLILNLNTFFEDMDYRNQQGQTLGGQPYIPLRPAFISNLQKHTVKQQVHSVLITLGGNDYRKLAPDLIRSLNNAYPDFQLHMIAGSNGYKEVLSRNMTGQHHIYGFLEVDSVVSLMLNADIVISAAGQTLHELAYLGVPTIAICVADDQRFNMKSYIHNRFLLESLYWDDTGLMDRIIGVLSIMQEKTLRQRLSENGKTIVDGKGLERIYCLLNDLG